MALVAIPHQEPAIDVIQQVRSAQIDLRANGRHVGSSESGQHQSAQARWQVVNHDLHVSALGVCRMRNQRYCYQRRQNPWPRTQRVVGHVKPQRRSQRMPFIFGAEDALCNITAAPRLRARIPTGPPCKR